MRSGIARILLIVTALWLPLQAVAGIAMKLTGPSAAAAVMAQAMDEQDMAAICPHHHADDTAPAAPQTSDDCEYCGVCHLAAGGYMPAAEAAVALVPAGRSFNPSPAVQRASHIPEPPQYPPKRNA